MNTEWDMKVFRVILAASCARKELSEFGIDLYNLTKNIEYVIGVINELDELKSEATEYVSDRLTSRLEKIEKEIHKNEITMQQKQCEWKSYQVEELQDDIDHLNCRKQNLKRNQLKQ